MNQVICVIPARGGSKGIPGKNIRPLGGKPLLAWSIEQARQTPRISRVFVSTDSEEIAKVARQFEAEVIQRPAEISGDTASSESCLVHALDYIKAKENLEPDLMVFLQPTSPLREADDIQKAIETLEREQADSLFSACRVEGFVWRVEKDGAARSFTYDHQNRPRRQDAPEDLIENGSIYIFKPGVLRQFNNRLGGKISVYRMPALNSFQIDEPADLELIEQLMAVRSAERGVQRTTGRQDHGTAGRGNQLSVVSSQLSRIKLLVLDFDGVLTDNRVLVRQDGTESVWCSRSDGLGIERLRQSGVEVVVLSKEENPVVSARCRKLGIECIQGCDNKLAALQQAAVSGQWSLVGGLKPDQIAYVGNDVNDLECLRWVGLPIAVADAIPEVKATAKMIATRPGGHGAVREVCEMLLKSVVSIP
jgi:N-acylneuraminate cytidylyltransferase